MQFKKKEKREPKLNLSPMIDVVFLILIYFVVSIQMEPSLDDVLKLPDAVKSSKQEDTQLQIYVLPAKLRPDGGLNPDSTGQISFADRAGNPAKCLGKYQGQPCSQRFTDDEEAPIPGALILNEVSYQDKKGIRQVRTEKICARCGQNVLFVTLDEVPNLLAKKKAEVLEILVEMANMKRAKVGQAMVTEAEKKRMEKEIPLMIKADKNTFYGRILQVVAQAKVPD